MLQDRRERVTLAVPLSAPPTPGMCGAAHDGVASRTTGPEGCEIPRDLPTRRSRAVRWARAGATPAARHTLSTPTPSTLQMPPRPRSDPDRHVSGTPGRHHSVQPSGVASVYVVRNPCHRCPDVMTPRLPFPTHIPTPTPTLYGHLEATQTTNQDLQQACTNRGFSVQVALGLAVRRST